MEARTTDHEHGKVDLLIDADSCPWCGSKITREEFVRITDEIRAEEAAKQAKQRAEFLQEMQEKVAAARIEKEEALERQRQAGEQQQQILRSELEQLKVAHAVNLEQVRTQLSSETEQALEQERQSSMQQQLVLRRELESTATDEREAALKNQHEELTRVYSEASVKREATERSDREALTSQLAELRALLAEQTAAGEEERKQAAGEIAKMAASLGTALLSVEEMKAREETIRTEAKDTAQREVQGAIEAQATELAREREAKETALLDVKELQLANALAQQEAAASHEKEVSEIKAAQQVELARQRQVLDEDHDKRLREEKAEQARKNEALEKTVIELQRKLEEKRANELGEGAEIDLFQTLRDEYPEDKVTRIPKGTPGADILFEVLHRGEVCGKIVIDSKNRQQWRDGYVTKLREDQREEQADHAILASLVFPAGEGHILEKQICLRDGVIVANPGRVVAIVRILRESMLRLHQLQLSNGEREGKVNKLYDFITSERFQQLFAHAEEMVDKLEELDVAEKKAHDRTWKDRGTLGRKLQHAMRNVDTEIRSIVEGKA